jgi:hypothetical protein
MKGLNIVLNRLHTGNGSRPINACLLKQAIFFSQSIDVDLSVAFIR